MVSFPPCKINLGLQILQRRADGYHDIDTCFYPLPLTDVLEIIKAPEFKFTISGGEIPGDARENLCVKAYEMLRRDFALPPVNIHLHKVIPTGAGLGGGSSDAAYTLRLLDALFDLKMDRGKLHGYAAQLGSDCSFFLHDGPMFGMGRGEILKKAEVSLAGKYIILLNPGLHISTAEAYAGVMPARPPLSVESILPFDLVKWKGLLQNDFEPSVFTKYPLIGQLKKLLYENGAVYASMTGSGSTVYGLFNSAVNNENEFAKMVIWKGYL